MLTVTQLLSPAKSINPKNPNSQIIHPIKFKTLNFTQLHSRLINQINVGDLHQAISTLDFIAHHHPHTLDHSTYSLLLKQSIRTRHFNIGKLIHTKLLDSGLELDTHLFNLLISLYSKCGEWWKAKELFDMMEMKRDLVSWSGMLSCFVINRMEFEALQLFVDMLEFGFCPNEFGFSSVIRACSNVDWAYFGEIVHGFLLKTGYFDDLCVGCELIDMYVVGFESFDYARKVFDKMPVRNVVVWTQMITRAIQMGFVRKAIELFLEMELSGCWPDKFAFTSVLSACAEVGWLSFGKQLHSRIIRSGLADDASVGCSLIEMYAKCDDRDSIVCSRKVFDRISDNNVLSWTALINAHTRKGGHDKEALELYVNMIEAPVAPNHFTLARVVKACTNLSDLLIGEQIYGHAIKLGFASDNGFANSLISMYSQSGKMEKARKAFDVLSEKDLVSYNTLLDGYTKNENANAAFELFHRIENSEMRADEFTLTSILSATASVGAGGKGEQIHARVIKLGWVSNQHICNALICMYSRCGDIEAAHRVFNEMRDRNIISWTSMITGFAKHGFARKALDVFYQMTKTGLKPNEVTFAAVLSACSHVGMVSEGKRYFELMYTEYGVDPTMEHYACMVDLFGRAGFIIEALEFINSMPFKANSLVWRTLIGACLVHGNIEIGEHAANMLVAQDPDDPASYTLISNLYASKGQWEDVQKIRAKMKDKNLNKEAGVSWVETETGVVKFFVGDTSHPRAREIHNRLNELIGEIREMGYKPNTEFVLHNLEEEEKEQYLLQHSEKIAVAYEFLKKGRSKPIRVFKNLRICGDCHTAMKYISKIRRREIIVRDSKRFHHFRDGLCSCNDHW